MDKINLTLTTGEDKTSAVVHLNASFETREMAIDFHAKIAALCRDASRVKVSSVAGDFTWPLKRLQRA